MLSIIVAFPKMEDAKNIRAMLIRSGYSVSVACTTGAQVVGIANELDGGIVLCGYRLTDMHYSQLYNYLPKGFEMLLMASPTKLGDMVPGNIVCLPMPIKSNDLLNTLQMMTNSYIRRRKKKTPKPKTRTEEEKAMIQKAKFLLMDRNNMTEEEAHHYIQKTSMDSCTNMVETAEMILTINS